jgi:hypothetical protein
VQHETQLLHVGGCSATGPDLSVRLSVGELSLVGRALVERRKVVMMAMNVEGRIVCRCTAGFFLVLYVGDVVPEDCRIEKRFGRI